MRAARYLGTGFFSGILIFITLDIDYVGPACLGLIGVMCLAYSRK